MNTVYRMAISVLLLSIFLGGHAVSAATYYVATTGNDSNPGTSDSPWRNPQRCTASPVAAGDTCTVANGTYTDIDANGVVVYASGSSVSGNASQPITIKSEHPLGAVITVSSAVNSANAGFYITRPYYIIEGFEISGGANPGSSASHNGIVFTATATGGIARMNSIHHIGRTVCSNSVFGYDGVLISGASDVRVEANLLYSIGRLRQGESGCSTSIYQNDHGIYIEGASNTTVLRNVVYDTNRGWPIHVYKSGGTTTNLQIYHNTLIGHSPTGLPVGHIMLAAGVLTASIKNNISYDATIGMVNYFSLAASNVTVSFNLSDTLEKNGTRAGVAFLNNLQNTSPGFVNAAGNDFHLNADSRAINAGTNIGVQVNDAAPDIGAYEFSGKGGDLTAPLPPQNVRLQ